MAIVPDGFREEVKRMTLIELAVMRRSMLLIPKDKPFLDVINDEIRRRNRLIAATVKP